MTVQRWGGGVTDELQIRYVEGQMLEHSLPRVRFECMRGCRWLWEELLTIPIIPQVEHAGQTWKLPAEYLYDSPFIEYDHLDNLLHALDGDDPDGLIKIIATILRPVNSTSQRIPFDGMQLDRLADELTDLTEPFKAYCLLFAAKCLR